MATGAMPADDLEDGEYEMTEEERIAMATAHSSSSTATEVVAAQAWSSHPGRGAGEWRSEAKGALDQGNAENAVDTGDDADGYEHDEEEEDLMRPFFRVTGAPDFESGPPTTAEEYLRRVRWEAKKLPQTVISGIDPNQFIPKQTKYAPVIPVVPTCRPELLPVPEWEEQFAATFADLRQSLSHYTAQHAPDALAVRAPDGQTVKLPAKRDRKGWYLFCLGIPEDSHTETDAAFKRRSKRTKKAGDTAVTDSSSVTHAESSTGTGAIADSEPNTDIDAMDITVADSVKSEPRIADQATASTAAVSTATNQPEHSAGAADAVMGSTGTVKKAPPFGTNVRPLLHVVLRFDQVYTRQLLNYLIQYTEAHTLSQPLALWLYALLARLDKPILADTAAMLKALYRRVAILRSRLHCPPAAEVAYHNMILTIVHHIFGQKI